MKTVTYTSNSWPESFGKERYILLQCDGNYIPSKYSLVDKDELDFLESIGYTLAFEPTF